MREITGRQAIGEAIREEMLRDEKVFMIGEDIGVYGGAFGVSAAGNLTDFGPERIRETPIAEQGYMGIAVGAALLGMRPIVEFMFMDFLMLGSDMLANQAAKIPVMFGGQLKVPLVVRTPAGAAGAGGQHTQSLEAWFTHVPGLTVIMPSTPYDYKGLLKSAIRSDNPVLFVEHKHCYREKGEVPEEEYLIPIGKADVKRQGKDVTVVATAHMVYTALKAADILAKEGIDVEVVDPRTLVPLDIDTIVESVCKTGHCVITHEAYERGGYGAEIAAQIQNSKAFDYLDAPIKRVCGLNVTIAYTPVLEKEYIPSVERLIAGIKESLYRR